VNESEAEIRAAREMDFQAELVVLEQAGVKFSAEDRQVVRVCFERAWLRGAKWANQNAVDVMTRQ